MRRKDKAISDSSGINAIIEQATVCRLAMVDGLELKRQALGIIMAQYSAKPFEFPENKVNATAVIKVEIEKMTGKQSGF